MRITKRTVYSGLAGVGLLLGAGGIAAAATSDTTSPPADVVQQTDDHDAPPAYTSSVQTDPEVETVESEAAEDAAEAEEDTALAALATVTPEEASAAALASQPGTVDDVELENENGNVVYEVEIVDAKGAEFDVIIDAGNASVLATEAD